MTMARRPMRAMQTCDSCGSTRFKAAKGGGEGCADCGAPVKGGSPDDWKRAPPADAGSPTEVGGEETQANTPHRPGRGRTVM